MILKLGQGLVYKKVLNINYEKIFKIRNLNLKVSDIICPIFVGNKLIEKRIFEIGEKNELIFSFSRKKIILNKLTKNGINYFFSFYKKLSYDETRINNYLLGYTKKDKTLIEELLKQMGLGNIKLALDSEYLVIEDIEDFKLKRIEDVISFLILGIIFYGDIQIKKDGIVSFKIFWKILNENNKLVLDFVLDNLAKNGFFVKSDIINGDNDIYQFFSNDWELIENLLNISQEEFKNISYLRIIKKIEVLCKKYNCMSVKNDFIWKVVKYG